MLNALMGEQQRPQQVTSGLLQGLRSRLPVLALAGGGLWVRARSRRTTTQLTPEHPGWPTPPPARRSSGRPGGRP